MAKNTPDIIRKARQVAGLTQDAAAKKLGLSVRMLRYYESGEYPPKSYVLAGLLAMLKV